MDYVSFARLTSANFWPVDDKAPFLGPSTMKMTSRKVPSAVPEEKESGEKTKSQSGAKSPEDVDKEKAISLTKAEQ